MVDSVSPPKINSELGAPVQRALAKPAHLARFAAFRDSILFLVLCGVWVFFYFATNGTFLTQRNLILLALQTSIVSLAAISAVMLIVTRNFDLSVGSAVALVGVILALLTVKYDVNPWISVVAALGGGVAMGIWQGLWVAQNRHLIFHRDSCGDVVLPRLFDDRYQWGDSRSVAGRSNGPGDGFLVSCAVDRPDCYLP